MKKYIIIILVLLALLGGYYFSGLSDNAQNNNTNQSANAPDSGQKVVINITARNWAFDPSTVEVKQGDQVQLVIQSADVSHGFALPDFNISQRVEPGQTTVVNFVADKVGTFNFFCDVYCGEGHGGMTGQLIVK